MQCQYIFSFIINELKKQSAYQVKLLAKLHKSIWHIFHQLRTMRPDTLKVSVTFPYCQTLVCLSHLRSPDLARYTGGRATGKPYVI